MYRPWVEVDLGLLRENFDAIRQVLPVPVEPVLVLKANAYGHGLCEVARCASAAGAKAFATAYVHEALSVRAVAPEARIVILGAVEPGDVPALFAHGLTPVVVSGDHGRALAAAARAAGVTLDVHLKIDTGMGRMGFDWADAATEAGALVDEPGLRISGLCTHFARVDCGEDDPAREQVARFRSVAQAIEARAGRRLFKHVSSSRALLCRPEWDFDGVRPGIILYGYGASGAEGRLQTRPILQWKTRVLQVRRVPAGFPVGYFSTHVTSAPTTLAVLACGYADGYLRELSNKGHVLIGGRRCPVVGRVSMNWITADAGPGAELQAGDEAVLIGRQGGEEIWADELATQCRTIPYEILTNIDPTIERHYVDASSAGV